MERKSNVRIYFVFLFIFIIIASAIALSGQGGSEDPIVKVISYDEYGNEYRKSFGAITVMGGRAVILTDYHVVEEVNSATIVMGETSKIRAKVLKDPKTQTALLIPSRVVSADKLRVYNTGDSSQLVSGEMLYIHDENGKQKAGLMENMVPSYAEYYSQTLITSFTSRMFERGKPILNYRNEIVGVITFFNKDRIVIPINTYKETYYAFYKKGEMPSKDPSGDILIETGIPINIHPENEINMGNNADFDSNNGRINTIYSKSGNVTFGEIEKIQFGLENSIYVLDKRYERVYRFDQDYNLLYCDKKPTNKRLVKKPVSFAVTPAGIVYVLENRTNSSIKILNRELEFVNEKKIAEISSYQKLDSPLISENMPHYDIEAGEERVFVLGKNMILIFDEKLNMLNTIGGSGIREDRFANATDIAVLKDDSFAVLDQAGAVVKLFDRDGNYLRNFRIHAPVDNAISSFRGDHILVSDKSNGKLKLFSMDGNFIRLYHVKSGSPYGVAEGVIFDTAENMHVYYKNQSFINVFSSQGNLVKTVSNFYPESSDRAVKSKILYNPKLLAVTPNKTVLADYNNTLHIYNRSHDLQASESTVVDGAHNINKIFTITDSTAYSLPLRKRYNISGIAGDDETDTVYITESIRGKVYKYNINSGELSEILIKLPYLDHDFVPVLMHFDGENMYISDKINDRVIVADTQGVIQNIEKITIQRQGVTLPIIDVATTKTGRGKEILVLTEHHNRYYIHNYDSNWNPVSSNYQILIDEDFSFGRPSSIEVYGNTVFVVDPYENHIMTYNISGEGEESAMKIRSDVGVSYLSEPSDMTVKDGKLYLLDKSNNRAIEYNIGGSSDGEIVDAESNETELNPEDDTIGGTIDDTIDDEVDTTPLYAQTP